jgi:hypothetical protein
VIFWDNIRVACSAYPATHESEVCPVNSSLNFAAR